MIINYHDYDYDYDHDNDYDYDHDYDCDHDNDYDHDTFKRRSFSYCHLVSRGRLSRLRKIPFFEI